MLKIPPFNLEAERAIIGSMLIDKEIIELYFDEFDLEAFYDDKNKIIMNVIYELACEGVDVDFITIKTKLEEKWKLKKIWWIETILSIIEETPTSSNYYSYSKIIENDYKRREIIKSASLLKEKAFNMESSLDEAVEKGFTDINNVLSNWASKLLWTETVINKLKLKIEEWKSKSLLWTSWNIPWLDKYTWWIRKWKTYRLAWNSWIGKTNIFYSIIPSLLKQWKKVMFVSLENDIESTYIKLMSNIKKCNPSQIENWNVVISYDWIKENANLLYITDQITDWWDIKREVLKVKPDIVLLDFVQQIEIKWMYDPTKILNFYAKDLKNFLLKNPNMAWIDISQLAMNSNQEEVRRSGNFKGSWDLKNVCDFGLHIFYNEAFFNYRNFFKNWVQKDEVENATAIDFVITKNRLWPTFWEKTFKINFNTWINYKEVADTELDKWNNF